MVLRCTHLLMVTILVTAAIQLAEIYLPKTLPPSFATSGVLRREIQTACHCPAFDPKTGCKCSLIQYPPSTETPATSVPTSTSSTETTTPPTTTRHADTTESTTTMPQPSTTTSPPTTSSKMPTTWYTTTVTDTPTTTTASPTTTTTGVESTTTLPGYQDCHDAYIRGQTTSGVYTISPDGLSEVQVYCEQDLLNGGWTVFQRRKDGSQNFYLYWDNYTQGFGDAAGEYWLGNEYLHQLTANQDTQLLVELQYGGETLYARYSEFWVLSEGRKYELHVTGYSGEIPPGDSLNYHNGLPFSTRDRDHDTTSSHCAREYSGAWWYKNCRYSNQTVLKGSCGTAGSAATPPCQLSD